MATVAKETEAKPAMTIDLDTLEERYLDCCKRQEVQPNSAILSGFCKAKIQKSRHKPCSLQVFLDKLNVADFPPLIDLFSAVDSSEINAVDILHGSPWVLNGEYALSLMRAVTQKLRIVDLHDLSFGKDVLRDIFFNGLACQILNLRSSHIQKLSMIGKFMQLQTLNLDFSISLTSLREDCFACMPNLMCISMCGTRVSNLWTTTAALSKLPSLVELRFQNCLCCNDTGPCSASSSEKSSPVASDEALADTLETYSHSEASSFSSVDIVFQNSQYPRRREDEIVRNLFSDNLVSDVPLENTTEESSDDSEMDVSSHQHRIEMEEQTYDFLPETVPGNEGNSETLFAAEEAESLADFLNLRNISDGADTEPKKYVPHHPSPICFERHYREYMLASLPRLEVLDNLPINDSEREMAKVTFLQYYEYSPYNRRRKENLVSVLRKREMGAFIGQLPRSSNLNHPYLLQKSQRCFSRDICAAKVGSFSWPFLQPLSKLSSISREECKIFRPRQFEYHVSDASLMVFGTLDGEIVVINHETGKLVGYVPSRGTLSCVLGLSWFRKNPSKLIVGSDNGSLQLYDIRQMLPAFTETYHTGGTVLFDDFDQLTSVHVNSTDEQFIASGYSKDVALYDLSSGKRLQIFTDMHQNNINVVKFANHSPSIFATASFDRDVKMWDLRQRLIKPCYTTSSLNGNVMVCFSSDDHYLLASAVDNEVQQLLAVDGRVHMKFEIPSTGSPHNYTRSYYMNGRDYIISGSSDEHIVRICCAQTGRRLRDVALEARSSGNAMFVQSLRGDPFKDFHMSVLATYLLPNPKSEIIKVNLMASSDNDRVHSYHRLRSPPSVDKGC